MLKRALPPFFMICVLSPQALSLGVADYGSRNCKMAINSKLEDGSHKQWLNLTKWFFFSCVIYGVVVGSIFHLWSLRSAVDNQILFALDYPGFVTFLILDGILAPYGNSLGLLIPSILAWSLIGIAPYAIARIKIAMTQLDSTMQA